MNIRGTFKVKGIVQGVRYREAVLRLARDRSLVGFVKNRKEGSVRVVAEGEETTIRAFAEILRVRSGRIEVDDVAAEYSAPKGRFTRFRIIHGKNISDGELEILEKLDSGLDLMDRLGQKQDATQDSIKAMDSNIGGHFERLEGRQDATTEAVKTLGSDIRSMDSNIGGHFDRLDTKYDAFGASLTQVADDIHDVKGDTHEMKSDLRKAVAGNR